MKNEKNKINTLYKKIKKTINLKFKKCIICKSQDKIILKDIILKCAKCGMVISISHNNSFLRCTRIKFKLESVADGKKENVVVVMFFYHKGS